MSRRVSLLLILLCGWNANLSAQSPAKPAGSPSASPSATPTTKALIDSMDSAELKEAIQLLKNNYIKPEALNETELSRATFEGILTRLGRGVILLSDATAEPAEPAAPFFGEILEGHIGYLRLGALTRPNLAALDANLQTFAAKKVDAAVIDLRASPATNDFPLAAEFAKRF
ncbi:MAG: hypothetical protein QOG51_356, partial [Verrucomicrobiota bacterium]